MPIIEIETFVYRKVKLSKSDQSIGQVEQKFSSKFIQSKSTQNRLESIEFQQ